jgi:hypothetical protein
MAGLLKRPLYKKLGLTATSKAARINQPRNYDALLGAGAPKLTWQDVPFQGCDFAHVFCKDPEFLENELRSVMRLMAREGMIWVSWPKKSSAVPSDVTEDVIRDIALPMGLVDIKVCSVDEIWSALKLVIRLERR